MYFVYLVRCRGNTLYAGITTDLARRMRQHRGELPGGAQYTRSHPVIALESAWYAEKLALIAHPEQLAGYPPLDAAALSAAWCPAN